MGYTELFLFELLTTTKKKKKRKKKFKFMKITANNLLFQILINFPVEKIKDKEIELFILIRFDVLINDQFIKSYLIYVYSENIIYC